MKWSFAAFLFLFVASAQANVQSTKPLALKTYRNDDLNFQIKIPNQWIEFHGQTSVGFKMGRDGFNGALGVVKNNRKGITIEQAAHQEYKRRQRPQRWEQHLMKLGDRRALKVDTTMDSVGKEHLRMLYVEARDGYYLIQCVGPAEQWATLSPIFQTVVQTFEPL